MTTQKVELFTFDKSDKVQEISLNLLDKSVRRDGGLANIRSIPMQFWIFYNMVTEMIKTNDLNFTEQPIWVQNNSSKAYLTDSEKLSGSDQKNAPINRWRFDKIITTIQLPNMKVIGNEARNFLIGLTLNQSGLSAAFGMNVHACANFNIMGGTILRTYTNNGHDGLGLELFKHKLDKWIGSAVQIWNVQNEIMDAMKKLKLRSDGEVSKLMGDLYMGAIRNAYPKLAGKDEGTPFDTYRLSDFTKEMLIKKGHEAKVNSVWELYNWGTSIMKPGTIDIGDIAENSHTWADYLSDRYGINNKPEFVYAEEV